MHLIRGLARTRIGARAGAVTVLLALLLAFSCLAASTALATVGTSHIKGHVTDKVTGQPVASVQVMIFAWYGYGWDWAGMALTDGSGNYDADGLVAGTYRVGFAPYWVHSGYATQYYKDKRTLSDADGVVVGEGATVSGIDAALVRPSDITGHVTDKATGHPLKGVVAVAYSSDGNGGWEWASGGQTDASGYYDAGDLSAGTYRVAFLGASGYPEYLTQYFNGKSTLEAADDVVVGDAATRTGIDAAMVRASDIRGRVIDKKTRQPLGGVDVVAYVKGSSGDWGFANEAMSDASGYYDLRGLEADTYRVKFSEQSGYYATQYATQFYKHAKTLGGATNIVLGVSSTKSRVNAALAPGAHITGRVLDRKTRAPMRAWVTAYIRDASGWVAANQAQADASGYYDVGRLAAGTYVVRFADQSGFEPNRYQVQYYDGKPDAASAKKLHLTVGKTLTSINAAMILAEHDPPVTTSNAGNSWHKANVSVTLTATDTGSGVLATYYRLNGKAAKKYTSPISVSAEGTNTLEFWSVDWAGNVETTERASVRIDKTAPTLSVDAKASYVGVATIHATATDALSGIGLVEMKIDSGPWTTGTQISTKVVGSHTVYARAVDVAGNERQVSAKFKVLK